MSLAVIILAAGLGKRMGGNAPKTLTQTDEGTLLSLILKSVSQIKPSEVVLVVGFGKEEVQTQAQELSRELSIPIKFSEQKEQKGTGHAALAGLSSLSSFKGDVLILYGDVPLITPQTIQELISVHKNEKATISLISEKVQRNTTYGRIIRNFNGTFVSIKEWKDCTTSEKMISETNSGVYLVNSDFLNLSLKSLKPNNSQGELYLTDIAEIAVKESKTVSTLCRYEDGELFGVNDFSDLIKVNEILRARRVDALMKSGVTFLDPKTAIISPGVSIASGVVIGPNVQITGKSSIGEGVVIEGGSYLSNVTINKNATIKLSVRAEDAVIGEGASVGPFAHLRPKTNLGKNVKVGNFVETKAAVMHEDSKASHLTYLGDCEVGAHANIGAGTITCNYDGFNKFKTTIGEGAFIGSNSSLIAPVTIGEGAIVGAGSAISKDVPKDSLTFTRAPQVSKEGWAKSFRKKNGV